MKTDILSGRAQYTFSIELNVYIIAAVNDRGFFINGLI